MLTEHYKSYDLWGHAIEQLRHSTGPARFAASGTVTNAGKLVAASDVLDVVVSEEAA